MEKKRILDAILNLLRNPPHRRTSLLHPFRDTGRESWAARAAADGTHIVQTQRGGLIILEPQRKHVGRRTADSGPGWRRPRPLRLHPPHAAVWTQRLQCAAALRNPAFLALNHHQFCKANLL